MKILCLFKKSAVVLLVCGIVNSPAYASDFEDWKKQQQAGFVKEKNEFDKYREEILAAFGEYMRKTGAVWGDDNIMPDKTRWISYIDSLGQRSVVDFEQGVVNVEVAVDQSTNDEQGKIQLEQALLKAMNQGVDERPMQAMAKQPVSRPVGDAVLTGQISTDEGEVATQDEYKSIAEEAAAGATKKTLKGSDGKTRVVYQTQLKLVPAHIRVRAAEYLPLVNKYAAQYDVPVPVVFAVMETESMFNPAARSAAPAFGLMQLVPTSGARDAYRYVYKKDKVVSDTYLYNPENNIRLGSAYLRRLNSDYLGGIESEESRMLATIAAYNTGAGNVFRTFSGKYSKSRHGSYSNYKRGALAEINKRSPEQVYQYLRNNLPHAETRRYIMKVTDRMEKYEQG